MNPIDRSAPPTSQPFLAAILSFVVPGAGQYYLKKRSRAIAILGVFLVLAALIQWALINRQLESIFIGPFEGSWLSIVLGGYWLWNVIDAYRLARHQPANRLIPFILALAIVYVLAWQMTDVRLDRLVTRFSDARTIFTAISQPDLYTRDTTQQTGQVSFWVPCTNPPQALPAPSAPNFVSLDKSCGVAGDTVTLHGENFYPGEVGTLHMYAVGGTNETQIFNDNKAVQPVVGPDGKFDVTFKITKFAEAEGVDPAAPLEKAIAVQFVQPVGPIKPSETFYDIILGRTNEVGVFNPSKILETLALGILATIFSTLLAIPLSFLAAHNIMSRVPGGQIVYYVMRIFFNFVRAVDPIIWGLIIISWIGQGPFTGVVALTVHSTAALGKLFSEEIEHIDLGPVEAVSATGANLVQVLRYAVVPQIYPPFLAYTLLRWDINMRSATIIGFVAGGGIGAFVVETIRQGGYRQYAAALWVIAIVIMLIDYISGVWRQRILQGSSKAIESTPRPFYRSLRSLVIIAIGIAVFVYSWQLTRIDLGKMFEPSPTFGKVVSDFISIDLSQEVLEPVLKQMLVTIFQALIATTLGGLLAIPFSFLAARNLTGRERGWRGIYFATRSLFNILRSIETLLYVAIFVFWVGIGAFAGSLALAVTTFAFIGKLFSEAIENIDPGPLEAISATGANRLQVIIYGIVPQIIPPFVSYAIYQWDINVRISTVIGFTGGGGIGLLLNTYVGQLQYHKAGVIILFIVLVINAMDLASAKIRERMV
ncbi:MAG TPA: phosphonate ABC transporter, permease protein PhnE [Anaerolineae bacterium]|nr:phosphonate ABC transporter, permease protein PhnE [Anaerolineae bacterium]